MSARSHWTAVCELDDIVPDSGVCALVDGVQVALFRVGDAVHAIGNHDPLSGTNVLSRGIVGDLGGELVVASPIYKQHFNLVTGRCVEEPEVAVPAYLTRIIEGRVWVQARSSVQRLPVRRRLVVIGNGMAALRTVEELLAHPRQPYDITIFSAEPGGGYNRVLLSPLLAGEKRTEEVITHPMEWYAQQGIKLHSSDPVVAIDRVRRTVRAASGVEAPYDRLLIASGSLPVNLAIPGVGLPGVVSFRDLGDVSTMLSQPRARQCAVVIGGGVLGIEAAHGLMQQDMQVTVVHAHAALMNRQLDAPAAALLREELTQRGLNFRMATRPTAILGSERAVGVQLDDGTTLAAELVVVAVGTEPAISLARAAGLRCQRGILVDDTMQTFDPAIYAVGECVQHRNTTFGLVAPLMEQARVCAAHLADSGVVRFGGTQPATQLKVSGIQLYAIGDVRRDPGSEDLVLRDARLGIYKRLVVDNNRVRGAVLYGDTRDSHWYFELVNGARDVSAIRDGLLFGEAHCQSPS